MSKSSNIAIWISLALPLLTAPLWADGIINGGGSSSGSGIVSACTAGNSQLLYSNAGTCAGTTDLLYSQPSGNATLISQAGGNFNFGTGFSGAQFSLGNGGAVTVQVNATNGFVVNGGPLITATASMTALTTGTNADFLCLAANGTVLLQTSACTISSLRFKPDWKLYTDNALTKISNMEVGTFHTNIPNKDPNAETLQAGLNAENIAKIAPECAVYENDMITPKSYRQECVIALLVRSIQELRAKK